MKLSQYFIPTLKENPADAEIISHRLMIRAGMIRKLAAGVYDYLPIGLKCIRKVENIVREEMNRAGAIELLMPFVSPAELWKESKRWDYYGKELLRFKDRAERDFCLGPTHEEIITDIVRKDVRSYKQLPINLYQIQTKFRDEIRPRFGVMRAREFIMKDAYSFDATDEGADRSYMLMYEAYNRIFERCGLEFKAVLADTGNIGGNFSHEFMVLAPTGEDVIMSSTNSDYAANLELAEIGITEDEEERERSGKDMEFITEVDTPNMKTVEEVATDLKVTTDRLIKTLIVQTDKEIIAALVKGDAELSLAKLRKTVGAEFVELASPEVIKENTGGPLGFSGPVGMKRKIRIIADRSIRNVQNAVTGANKTDKHLTGVNAGRDFEADIYADIRLAKDGDKCPVSRSGTLKSTRGIEVGHVFKLGTKYSEAMNATFSDVDGKEKPFIMGCYGIGIGRTLAAAIEQGNDVAGIKIPAPIAPFDVSIIPTTLKDERVKSVSEKIYKTLNKNGTDVLIDDRNESAEVKFKDADLTGIPFQIIIGPRTLENEEAELKDRIKGVSKKVKVDEVVGEIGKLLG